jgi:hypothetical protein
MKRLRLFVTLLLFPVSALAEQGDWGLFALLLLVVPTVIVFLMASTAIWLASPARARPWAIALCAIPLSPISNGSYRWPLSVYLIDWDRGVTPAAMIWPIILTVLATYLAVHLISLAQHLMSRKAWRWGVTLAAFRIVIFVALYGQEVGVAQSMMKYWPLWVLDFPISIAYFVKPLSIPLLEAIIGPVWWLFMPAMVSRCSGSGRTGKYRSMGVSQSEPVNGAHVDARNTRDKREQN